MARVINFVGEFRRERVVFDGTEADAQAYIAQHFPRLHVEPGMDYGDAGPIADAVLEYDDKSRKFWDGREMQDWEPPASASNPSNGQRTPDERDDRIAELEAQLAQQSGRPPVEPPPDPQAARIAELEAQVARAQAQQADTVPVVPVADPVVPSDGSTTAVVGGEAE